MFALCALRQQKSVLLAEPVDIALGSSCSRWWGLKSNTDVCSYGSCNHMGVRDVYEETELRGVYKN